MPKRFSIAEARNDLARLVHMVEKGAPVELTRRGKTVAVLMSAAHHEKLGSGKKTFTEALREWRASVDFEEVGDLGEAFVGIRDQSAGRLVEL